MTRANPGTDRFVNVDRHNQDTGVHFHRRLTDAGVLIQRVPIILYRQHT